MSNITLFQFQQMQARLARPVETTAPLLEKELHQDIIDHCDKQWPRWKYVHSRTDKPTRNTLGVPDFVIALPLGRTLYVEAKRPGQKPSLAQSAWHAEMLKLKHYVHVVHDMQEFLSAVEQVKQDWPPHV